MAGKGEKLRHRGMRQVSGQVARDAGVHGSVMFAKIRHQMMRFVALPLAVTDHDDPPAARDSRCDCVEETGVGGVGLGAVGVMLRAVDLMLQVVQFLWSCTHFATYRENPRAGMVDDNDQILRGGLG